MFNAAFRDFWRPETGPPHGTLHSNTPMKSILTTLVIAALAAPAFAGCGKTEDVSGKLKKIDSDTKEVTIGSKSYKLTPAVSIESLAALKGKDVTAKVGHNKVESISAKS